MPTLASFRVSGCRLDPEDDAHVFAQLRTLQISQFTGLDRSTGSSISPRRAGRILPIFIFFRELQR